MGRIDNIKSTYPELNKTILDIIVECDPTNTYKYVEFLIRTLKKNNVDLKSTLFGKTNLDALEKFEKHLAANRIVKNDISKYNGFFEIITENNAADEIVRLKELEKQYIKLYNNDEWLVMIPRTYESAVLYGKNTKWCITNPSYWNDYYKTHNIIFIINKKNDEKFAISQKYSDGRIEGWNATDMKVNPILLTLNNEIWAIIRTVLKKSKMQIDMDFLGNATDKNYTVERKIIELNDCNYQTINNFYKAYAPVLSENFKKILLDKIGKLNVNDNLVKTHIVDETRIYLNDNFYGQRNVESNFPRNYDEILRRMLNDREL